MFKVVTPTQTIKMALRILRANIESVRRDYEVDIDEDDIHLAEEYIHKYEEAGMTSTHCRDCHASFKEVRRNSVNPDYCWVCGTRG
jgi:hypothetical protein